VFAFGEGEGVGELRDLLAQADDLRFGRALAGGEFVEQPWDGERTGHDHRHGRVRAWVSRWVRFAVAAQYTRDAIEPGLCS
jgi:hypothetical protein